MLTHQLLNSFVRPYMDSILSDIHIIDILGGRTKFVHEWED